MASNNDIQSEMSTKITVDAQQAGEQVKNLTNKFKDLTASWKAEEAVAKANGDSIGASKARYEGLTQTLEVQKEKVETLKRERQALKSEMESSSTVTKEQTDDLKNLDRQLATAAEKVMSLSNQQRRAKNSFDYAKSGLRDLKNEYYNNNRAIDSNVEKLKAEGQTAEAQKAKLTGLKISLENLNKQQEAAKKLADEAAKSEGSNSNLYKRRITDYNKISAAIAKTKTESEELNKVMNPPKISGWTMFREKILGVSSAEDRAASMGAKMKGVFSGAFLGSLTGNVLPMLQTQLQGITTNGMKAAQAGMAIQGRWKNIGASASGIKELTAQVAELRTHSNLAVQTINSLQTRFYGMTKSVSQTKALTQGVASLADSMKLSEQQANGFANGLNRIESSGKVTSASLGRLEKQAPGLATQLAKAAGMSQQQFNALVSSGKMTTKQFNSYLEQASKSYDKNAKAFTSSASGSAHSLQQQWAITQATLAKPLVKVEATGLNQLNQALSNKDTQRGLQALATGMATLAVNAAKAIAVLARHQTVVKGVATAVLGLVGAYKGMQIVVSVNETIRGFTKVVSGSSVAMKAFGVATRFMTGPIGIAVTAITALVAGFTALYRHNAKFRSFVNGIARNLKNMAKGFVKTGRNILKGATNLHKKLSRSWNNYWKEQARKQRAQQKREARYQAQRRKQDQRAWNTMKRNAARGWKSMERSASNGVKRVGKWYSNMSRTTGRAVQNMARNHPRTFNDMYKTIQDRTRTWHDITNGHWTRLGSDIANEAKDMSATSRSIFGGMYDKLNNITGGRLGDILNAWKKHFSNVISTITSSQSPVHQAFMGVLRGIAEPFSTIIKGITKGINWIADKIGGSHISEDFSLSGFANGTPGGGLLHDQIALLNDGKGEHYQEMIHKASTGKTFMLPAKRNIILPLEKGDEVLDGENSHRLAKAIGMPIPHANGAIGNFFSGIFDKTKDALEDATDWVDKALKNVVEFGTELFHHFVEGMSGAKDNGREFSQMMHNNLPGYFARIGEAWLKKQLEQMQDDNGNAVTPEMIKKAAARMKVNVTAGDISHIMTVVQHESNNQAHAQNNWDINAQEGHPSKGVLQFIDGTFNKYAMPGHHDIWKPFDQLLAMFNDTTWRSDLTLGGWEPSGNRRFANGGLITQHGLYEVGEYNHPEMIIPLDISKRGRAYSLLAQVMSQFKSEDVSNNDVNTEDVQVKALNRKFDALLSQNQQLIGLIDKLIGVTDSANNPTARYKRTQRDINLAQSQSFI
ncbi:tape measure protein [Limosilactobacillus vaginalis]|uniref:tape measure protein n=1 Tax=Limosilactobacillus vaginalis TaxID=1633 RepID=UPI0025A35B61|nr:tape measure protein [Limosilactobacillus vaginalis]MDM8222018.1 tape measure protein [Limosilactobacillus vaginalis]